MKSFKKFVAEVAQPKPEEEKRFKDMHSYETVPHPVAEPHQHTGEIQKPKAKRPADQEGDANYDKALKDAEKRMVPESVEQVDEESDSKEFQQEIDMIAKMKKDGEHERLAKMIKRTKALKGGGGWNMAQKPSKKQKDQYNKMVRDHKKKYSNLYDSYNEEVEQVDEVLDTPKAMQSYKSKAKASLDRAMNSAGANMARGKSPYKDLKTVQKRDKGLAMAGRNAADKTRKALVGEESVEQIDEISKELAQRYYTKASKSQSDSMSKMIKNKKDSDAKKTFNKRHAGLDNAAKRLAKEEVEQVDEISKELAGRYIKQAQVDSADAGMDTASQDKDIRKRGINKFLKRRKGVDSAVKRLMRRDESMADDRARYDAADDKNKKKVTLPKAPWDKKDEELSPKQKKLDHNKNGKIDGHDLAMLRAKKKNEEVELDETTSSAIKKMVTQTGPDGKTRTVMKKAKADRTDDRGQDKIDTRESVELEEAVKVKRGPLRLKDGSQIMVSKEDADLLSKMFKDLSPNNQRQMEKVMMMDKAGFEEIRGFAREAL